MPFDDRARWSWDRMQEGVTDRQRAAESVSYQQGCWWIEECLVREDNVIIGKVIVRTLISRAVPEMPYTRVRIQDDRFHA